MTNNDFKIAAVVVTYNRCTLLQECLDALEKQLYSDFDIIVIDNASTDGTEEIVRNRMSANNRIKYIILPENIGGAGGFCKGIEEACKGKYDYTWLMDDDTIPEEEALEKLVDVLEENQNIGFLSSKVLWKDSSLCKMNIPLLGKKDLSDKYCKVRKATFVSLLLSREAVENTGLPIKEFFIWGDDQEYTERISKKYNCYYIEKSVVIHKSETNNGSDIVSDSDNKIQRYYYKYRNELFISKNKGILSVCYYMYRLIKDIVLILFKSDNKIKREKVVLKGFCDGITFNPKIEFCKKEE